MNLFVKSYKIYLIFFLIIALKSSDLLGNRQDSIHYLQPRILEYNLPNKYINTPNTSFYISGKGVLFVGKENGVVIVDGSSHYFTAMEGPVYITSTDSERIQYLSSNDFGVLEYSPESGINKESHIHEIPSQPSKFYPYNLLSNDSSIFMATSEAVFVFHNQEYSWYFINRKECELFKTDHSVYLDIENQGLSIWRDSIFVPVIRSSAIQNARIRSIFESDSNITILTGDGKSYICDKSFTSLSRVKDYEIEGGTILYMETLPNGFCLAKTEDNAVFLTSKEGELLHSPHESDYLPDAPILSLLIDQFNDIWLLYEFGLFKFEYPSHSYTLNLPNVIAGKVLKTMVSDEQIYIGSENGLAILEIINNDQWIWKKNLLAQGDYINLLDQSGQRVFAGGKNKLYTIYNNEVYALADGTVSCLVAGSEKSVFVCREEGLVAYKENKTWKRANKN